MELTNEISLASIKTGAKEYLYALKVVTANTGILAKKILKMAKIPEIVTTILHFTRSIPFIGSLIPNKQKEETKVKEMLSSITTGDMVTSVTMVPKFIVGRIWQYLPLSTTFKTNIVDNLFGYNDRYGFIQALYKIMIDSEIEPKYARAYIIILSMKVPIYNILYVFKAFWSKKLKKSNPTIEDKIHPWTSGDPIVHPEKGMNETEMILERKVQKFIQAYKVTEGEVARKYKLTRMIIYEAFFAVVTPLLLPMFNFFKISFGVSDTNPLHTEVDQWIKTLLMIYYYYFLIGALLIATLAIDHEDAENGTEN